MKKKGTRGLPVTVSRNRAGLRARLCLLTVIMATLVCFSAATVYAGQETQWDNASQAFFAAKDQVSAPTRNIYAFFSTVTLTENASADNIYAFFSEIIIAEGAAVAGKIKPLSSAVILPVETGSFVVSPYINGWFEDWNVSELETLYSNKIPTYVLNCLFALIGAVAYLASYGMFKGFLKQGVMAMTAEPFKVMRNGVAAYLLSAIFILLFSLSVILLPIAAVLVMIFLVFAVVGQAALSMLIGLTVSKRLGKRMPALACLALGWLPVAVITNIPIINVGVVYIFLPILSTGITVTALINGFLKKIFYYAPFGSPPPARTDNRKIREIINGADSKHVV